MMVNIFIVEIMSGIFLIPPQEFGGIVMITISLKIVIYQKRFILERVTKKTE